jgi:glycolate oxidase FAD binding subunit
VSAGTRIVARDLGTWPAAIAALSAKEADPAQWAIGGRRPEAVLQPDSVAQAAQVLRWAAAAGLGVAPLGGGTGRGELAPPDRPFVALLTRGLAGVIEHAAPDLTVVVRAGTTLAALGTALAERGQRLPLDGPRPERGTIGGLIAGNRSGPLRLGHGTVRDYLIGIAVLDGAGNLVRAGGRVVKNVAGYDLMKLHAGARGTLGLIVEACFKVKPLPDEVACLLGRIAPEGAEAVRRELRRAQVPAVALEVASPPVALSSLTDPVTRGEGEARGELVIGLEGVAAEIAWQVETATAVLLAAGAGSIATRHGAAASSLLRSLAEFGGEGAAGEDADTSDPRPLRLRAAVLPSRMPELWRAFAAAAPGAWLLASAGSGILRCALPDPSASETASGMELVRRLRSLAVGLGGHLVVEALPPSWEGHVDRFGREPDPLMVGLKAALDPAGIFLPGSYLGLGGGGR